MLSCEKFPVHQTNQSNIYLIKLVFDDIKQFCNTEMLLTLREMLNDEIEKSK